MTPRTPLRNRQPSRTVSTHTCCWRYGRRLLRRRSSTPSGSERSQPRYPALAFELARWASQALSLPSASELEAKRADQANKTSRTSRGIPLGAIGHCTASMKGTPVRGLLYAMCRALWPIDGFALVEELRARCRAYAPCHAYFAKYIRLHMKCAVARWRETRGSHPVQSYADTCTWASSGGA